MDVIIKSVFGIGIAGITATLWYFLKCDCMSRSLLKLVSFRISHFNQVRNLYSNPAVVVILITWAIGITGVIRFFSVDDPYLYLCTWGIMILVESYCLTAYVFKLGKTTSSIFCFLLILLFSGIGIVLSIKNRSYEPMNLIDFIENIYLFIGSAFILFRIAKFGRFYEELDAFFIFFGILVYAFLHALSSSILSLNPFAYFDFAYLSTLITMLYWSAVIPWTRRVKSKLS
jgi:hypothetical protein